MVRHLGPKNARTKCQVGSQRPGRTKAETSPSGHPVIDWIVPRYAVITEGDDWSGLFAVAILREPDVLERWGVDDSSLD